MNNKRIIVLVLSLMMLIGLVLGMASCDLLGSTSQGDCEHQWNEATCTAPKTCTLCNATEGDVLGHTGGTATCKDKAVCTRCEKEYGELGEHEWSLATCDKLATCNHCGETSGEKLGHTPAEDDGDCTTAVNCTVCGGEITPAKAHTPAEDDGDCTTAVDCTVCGKVAIPAGKHTPAADDGDCTTAVNCTVCGKEVVAAKNHISAADDGDCTTAVNCLACGKVLVEANAHHIPAEDDGDCTTAVNCTVCGKTAIPAKSHTPEADDGDCTTAVSCTDCGKVVIAAAKNHSGKDDGDCTTAVNCTVCGKEITPANANHTPEEDDSDCDTPTKCANCDVITTPAKAHQGGNATCADKAVCDVCGKSYGTTLEHSFTAENPDSKYLATPATCEAAATYYYSCANCGDRSDETFEYGEPTGHNYIAWISNGDGTHTMTCLNDESHVLHGNCAGGELTCTDRAVCSECNEEYGDEPSHVWNDGVVETEPTCVGSGVMLYTCGVCGETKTSLINPVGHSYVVTVVDPTCLAGGYDDHVCSVCSDSYTDNDTPAAGHLWLTERTCTEGRFCSRGDCEMYESPLGHNYEVSETTEVGCDTHGSITYTCTGCGDSYINYTEAAWGHNIVGVSAVEEHYEGCYYLQVYTCVVCNGRVEGELVVHHTYTASISIPSTCKVEGTKVITCSACGDLYYESIPVDQVIGHNWVTGEVNGGKRTDTCSFCGETKFVTIVTNDTVTSVGDLKDTEISLESGANITLGGGAADHIGADTKVTVSADTLTDEDKANLGLTDEELAQVKGDIYNFNITSGDTNFTTFGENGYITVTLPYELDDDEDVDNIAIWYIDDKGNLTSIKATYNNGFVTFTTDHFSYYTVTRLTPAERCDLYGHIWADKDVEATCVSDGYTIHRCTRCGRVDKLNEVPAFGHDLTEVTTDATCTVDGQTIVDCSRCDYHEVIKLAAPGHSYVLVETVLPTCSSTGSEKYVCSNCDEEIIVTLAQLTHVYTPTKVEPTCEAGGYVIHQCNNCTYNYKDQITPALEHEYDAKWEWNDDHSEADVTLECKHGCGHSVHGKSNSTKKEHEATCSKEAKYEYTVKFTHNGKVYVEKYAENGDKLPHKFSDGWKFNKHGHWHDCKVCGEKRELLDHEYDEGTIIKRPGCNTKGEIAYVCMCGYVLVESIEPTGDHSFVGGVCVDCGFSRDCDHTTLTKVSIDLGELGYCKGVIEYETCDCGAVKLFDIENANINCESNGRPEMGEGVDENGIPYQYMSNTCPVCGLYLYAYATLIEDTCYEAINATYYFYTEKGGDLIIELTYIEEDYDHETEELPLGIKDKTCGTEIYLDKCIHCGHVENVEEIVPGCKFETGTENFYDDAGNPHQKQIMSCPDCGLIVSVEMYVVYDSVCEMTMYGILEVYIDGELFFDFTLEEHDQEHNYESTYELIGESCEDGYTVYETCNKCGDSRSWRSSGHRTQYEHFNFAEYGMCDGNGYRYVCSICNTVTSAYVNWQNCSWRDMGYDEKLGVQISQCVSCGAVRHYASSQTEKDEKCNVIVTYINKFFIGEYVIDVSRTEYRIEHSMKLNYTLEGKTCEDGWTLEAYCENCGYSYTDRGNHHNTRALVNVNLSALGMCGEDARFQIYSCACGQEGWSDTHFHDGCEWEETDSYTYVEENGIEHTVSTRVCRICNSVINTDSYYTADGCYYYYYTTYTITVNGQIVVDGLHARTSRGENHKYVYNYTMNGESCEDGWTCDISCAVCDYTSYNEGSWHNTHETVYYNLSELGMCGSDAYLQIYSCACGQEGWYNYNLGGYCEWEYGKGMTYVDDNGYTHVVDTKTCIKCNTLIKTDSYTVKDGCYNRNYTAYTIIINGETIVDGRFVSSGTWTSHDYSYEYFFNGESCEDGVTVVRTCRICGESYNDYYTDHNTFYTRYNLSEYGACDGWVEVYKCACGKECGIHFSSCGNAQYTSNQYVDENGILMFVESHACSICDLRYTRTYHYTTENCVRTYYYNVAVNVGAELIVNEDYISNETYHNYVETGTLVDGATYCGQGVEIISTCQDCGYSYSGIYYYHREFLKDKVELTQYGCECPGSFVIEMCACGDSVCIDTQESLCDFGYYGINTWIENTIVGWQETTEGDRYFGSNADSYVCAVTDPEQCGFTIRMAYYWLKNDDCTATYYLTVQFGYDELTDTCAYEKTYARYTRTFHNYGDSVRTSGDYYTTTTTTCVDCGSYREYRNEWNANGYTTKVSQIFVNNLNNGEKKYREYITEWIGYDAERFGNYEISWYSKLINADGTEFWEKTCRTLELCDVPFGFDGTIYKHTHTNSEGRDEYTEEAHTYVNAECCGGFYGSSFRLYYYSRNNNTGSWNRRDYVYDNSLCDFKVVHTSSSGEFYEARESGHNYTHYSYVTHPTCTQYGEYSNHCVFCNYAWDVQEIEPSDHNWVLLPNGLYYCYECGLQNINGASGDVVMEDLTNKYGDAINYVIGYWSRTYVQFSVYVSLMLHTPLADGTEQINLVEGYDYDIHFVEDPYVGLYVSKAQIEAAALALGYTADTYDVRISFVPDGSDGSFDYAITFADLDGSEDIDYVITRDEYFIRHVTQSDVITYTVRPEVSGYWRFSVDGSDPLYYGAQLQLTDETGYTQYGDSLLGIYLEGGKTYTLTCSWNYDYEYHGYVAFIFDAP